MRTIVKTANPARAGSMLALASRPHAGAVRVERRTGQPDRRAALAEDLDLEAAVACGKLLGNIAERQRLLTLWP